MGMFDYITFQGHRYQTKDTPLQLIGDYKIDDLQLWLEEHDSDPLLGYVKKNPRWVRCENFTGEIVFYRHLDKEYKVWETYSAYFHKGQLKEIHLLDHE
jgi:macrodomain Ter protein organizer (MatP/YcbG family)